MSNRVELVGTTFVNVTGEQTFGFRMYDEYESTYGNCFDAVIEDDLEFLSKVILDDADDTSDMLEFAAANGCYINGTWYDVDEISHLFATDAVEDA